jgi:Predicted transcriptional regulators containing the CopG/Arc/MetJ DNA-binding domain and a metal-binding domain
MKGWSGTTSICLAFIYDDDLLRTLDRVAKSRELSRTEVIRRAIALYLKPEVPVEESGAFGLWRGRNLDALALRMPYERNGDPSPTGIVPGRVRPKHRESRRWHQCSSGLPPGH